MIDLSYKKKIVLLSLITASIISGVVYSKSIDPTKDIVIEDVRGELQKDYATITIEANCDLQYVDYTLQEPFRIFIDPIGKTYTNLKDEIEFDRGLVRKIKLVKGRNDEKLEGDYYSLDFIAIELSRPTKYLISRNNDELILDIGKIVEQKSPRLTKKPESPPVQEKVFPKPPSPKVPRPPLPPKEKKAPISGMSEKALPLEEPIPLPIPNKEPPIFSSKPEGVEVAKEAPSPNKRQEFLSKYEKEKEVIPLPGMAVSKPTYQKERASTRYVIGEGDELDIFVWRHKELSKKVIVRPDGNISFPLVGDIRASGLTPPELSANIRENLSQWIKDPQVTVIVTDFGSKNIFVLGEVLKPGLYRYRGGMNVLNVLSDAGGWKNSAVLNSVMLVRRAFSDAPEVKRLDIWRLVKKGDFSQNVPLQPGDIVYVPKNFIANIGAFIENLKITVGAWWDVERTVR